MEPPAFLSHGRHKEHQLSKQSSVAGGKTPTSTTTGKRKSDTTPPGLSKKTISSVLARRSVPPDFLGNLQETLDGIVASQVDLSDRFTAVETRLDQLGGLVQSLEFLKEECAGFRKRFEFLEKKTSDAFRLW